MHKAVLNLNKTFTRKKTTTVKTKTNIRGLGNIKQSSLLFIRITIKNLTHFHLRLRQIRGNAER